MTLLLVFELWLARLDTTRDPEAVRRVAAPVDALSRRHPRDPVVGYLLWEVGAAWLRLGEFDRARKAFDHLEAGGHRRYHEAVRRAREEIAGIEAPPRVDPRDLPRTVDELELWSRSPTGNWIAAGGFPSRPDPLEKTRGPAAALLLYQASGPTWSCTRGAWGPALEPMVGIVRCRLALGQPARAARIARALLDRTVIFKPPMPSPPSPWFTLEDLARLELVRLLGEAAARSRRFDQPRRLPYALSRRERIAFETGVARVTHDPGRLYHAAEHLDPLRVYPGEPDPCGDFPEVGRLLGELGPPAWSLLREGIDAGRPAAIHLAEVAQRKDLLPAIEARLAREPDRDLRERLVRARDTLRLLR